MSSKLATAMARFGLHRATQIPAELPFATNFANNFEHYINAQDYDSFISKVIQLVQYSTTNEPAHEKLSELVTMVNDDESQQDTPSANNDRYHQILPSTFTSYEFEQTKQAQEPQSRVQQLLETLQSRPEELAEEVKHLFTPGRYRELINIQVQSQHLHTI